MTVLEAREISMRFGPVEALNNVSIRIVGGQVTGLVGDNGAGKSTLIKILSGVLRPSAGTLAIDGQEVNFSVPQDARRRGIETIYQDLALALHIDVPGNIFLGREVVSRRLGLHHLGWLDRGAMAHESSRTLAELGISIKALEAPCEVLSGGQRQAVAIAKAVLWGTKVLMMDEPTAALAVEEQQRTADLIRKLRSADVAVLLISHDLELVCALCDLVTVLRRGEIVARLGGPELTVDGLLHRMTGGKLLRQ